jgi:hypothetical protein
MTKTTSLADNETVIEFFSSQTVLALKKKKKFRRRAIALLLFTLPKILAVAYLGTAGALEALEASASVLRPQAIAPFIP